MKSLVSLATLNENRALWTDFSIRQRCPRVYVIKRKRFRHRLTRPLDLCFVPVVAHGLRPPQPCVSDGCTLE